MTDDIPQAIAESVLVIGDMALRCYVLDDGRRLFNAEDLQMFFERLEAGWELTPESADRIAEFCRGAV